MDMGTQIKVMVRDYMVEVKWREEKYKPTSEEYMRVGTATCAYTSLIIISFIGMGDFGHQRSLRMGAFSTCYGQIYLAHKQAE